MPSVDTINYAMPSENYFWRWSDSFNELDYFNGQTVAFWTEVQPVLKYLADEGGGLPPLGSIVLIIAACRNDLPLPIDVWVQQVHIGNTITKTSKNALELVTKCLQTVNQLPEELRTPISAKCHLISTIYETSQQPLAKDRSQAIVNQLTDYRPNILEFSHPDLSGLTRFYRDVKGIVDGLQNHDINSLTSLLETGISNIDLQPVDQQFPENENLSESNSVIESVRKMGEDGNLVANIAEQTIAMVHFPGKLDQPNEIPIGGISDITNRGTIDRLLPGELAYDDLTLAVRIVSGEALYFRREVPPQNTPRQNAIFLDRGIRLWGINRILSLGLAIGITQQTHWQNNHLLTATTDYSGWRTIDFTDAKQVKHLLEDLIPSAAPGEEIEDWWQTNGESINGDFVFISTRDQIKSQAVRNRLSQIQLELNQSGGIFYLALIDRNGDVEIESWSANGIRPVSRGNIRLETLLPKAEAQKPPSIDEIVNPKDFPSSHFPYYRRNLSPFLFPISPQRGHFEANRYVKITDGIIGIADKRIMRWSIPGRGGREVYPSIPGSRHHLLKNGEAVFLAAMETGKPIRLFRIYPGELQEKIISGSRHSYARDVQIDANGIIFVYSDYVEVFSLYNGEYITGRTIHPTEGKPIFRFDGSNLIALRAIKEQQSEDLLPFFELNKWEKTIEPTHVAISETGITLLNEPESITWELDIDRIRWNPAMFKKTNEFRKFQSILHDKEGVDLKKAAIGPIEFLYDSRGILHFRRVKQNREECISVLLLNKETSVWSKGLGVLSNKEELLPSEEQKPNQKAVLIGRLKVLTEMILNPQSNL